MVTTDLKAFKDTEKYQSRNVLSRADAILNQIKSSDPQFEYIQLLAITRLTFHRLLLKAKEDGNIEAIID